MDEALPSQAVCVWNVSIVYRYLIIFIVQIQNQKDLSNIIVSEVQIIRMDLTSFTILHPGGTLVI